MICLPTCRVFFRARQNQRRHSCWPRLALNLACNESYTHTKLQISSSLMWPFTEKKIVRIFITIRKCNFSFSFHSLSLFQKVWRDFTQLPLLPSGRDRIWEIAAQFWKVLRMCRLGAYDGKLLFNALCCHSCFWESAADQVPPSAPLCSDSYPSIRKSVWSKWWEVLSCWDQAG